MPGTEPLLSRRTALRSGTAVSVVALAGCGTGGAATTAPEGAPADLDPDTGLLRRALARERQVEQQLQDASRRHARLRTELQPLLARHRAHLEVLADALRPDDLPPVPTQVPPGLGVRARTKALARAERALADAHARAALEAASGPFARLLAGLAAAAGQQAHVLDGLS